MSRKHRGPQSPALQWEKSGIWNACDNDEDVVREGQGLGGLRVDRWVHLDKPHDIVSKLKYQTQCVLLSVP